MNMSAVAVAASAGVSFASGRRMTMFFSQTGVASWIGVLAASAVFGLVCGAVRYGAEKTGAVSVGGICLRGMGAKFGRVFGMLHILILCAAAWMMLTGLKRLSELSLSVHNAGWMGILISMICSFLLCMRGMRGYRRICGWTLIICLGFYTALMLDRRAATVRMIYETVPELSGSIGAAVLLGALSGALSGCVSAAACIPADGKRPARFAWQCGAGMLLMLSAANGAVLSGGVKLLSQPSPYAVMAARWGKAGYSACILTEGLAALSTLCASLDALTGAFSQVRKS